MRFLIVYYSFTNNNQRLAQLLAGRLSGDIARINEVKKRTRFTILFDLIFNRRSSIKKDVCSLKEYKHVIFVSPVWASKIATPMKTFLEQEKDNIGEYSFATVCSGIAGQREKIQKELISLVGKRPNEILELWVNDLLQPWQRDKIRYVTNYRINDEDLAQFEPKIYKFLTSEKVDDPRPSDHPVVVNSGATAH